MRDINDIEHERSDGNSREWQGPGEEIFCILRYGESGT